LIATFDYGHTSNAVDNQALEIYVGIGVVTQDALAAGAVPDPASDFHQDWLYWTRRAFKLPTLGGPSITTWDIDIRSARRLRGGYALVMVTETLAQNTTSQLQVAMRTLWSQEP